MMQCDPPDIKDTAKRLKDALPAIAEARDRCCAPSTSVGVLHHGRVLLSTSVGHRDHDPQHLANDESVYLLGSLSKAFVAAAVGILVDAGKIKWTDRISEYLPEFDPIGDPRIRKEADFIDLLRHSSGLGNPVVQVIGPFGSIIGREEKFMDLVNATQTDEEGTQRFNKIWEYSNINYSIVALAIEKVSNMRFADFVKTRILDPLGMKQTLVTHRQLESSDNLADGHAWLENSTWRHVPVEWTSDTHTSILAPFGMRSSIHDMLIWSAAWLSALNSPCDSSIPEALKGVASNPLKQVHRIFKPAWQFPLKEDETYHSTYCLGWLRAIMPTSRLNWGTLNKRTVEDKTHLDFILGTDSPERVVFKHTGIAYNTTCSLFLFPETQSAVITMSNGRRKGDASDFAAQILIQELFDLQPRVDILSRARIETERGADFRHNVVMREWLNKRDLSGKEQPPHDYTGVYSFAATQLHVTLDDKVDRLMLHFNHRSDKAVRLEYFGKDKYSFFPTTTGQHFSEGFFDFDNYKVGLLDFRRDGNGTVNGLYWTWEIESPPIWYTREPSSPHGFTATTNGQTFTPEKLATGTSNSSKSSESHMSFEAVVPIIRSGRSPIDNNVEAELSAAASLSATSSAIEAQSTSGPSCLVM